MAQSIFLTLIRLWEALNGRHDRVKHLVVAALLIAVSLVTLNITLLTAGIGGYWAFLDLGLSRSGAWLSVAGVLAVITAAVVWGAYRMAVPPPSREDLLRKEIESIFHAFLEGLQEPSGRPHPGTPQEKEETRRPYPAEDIPPERGEYRARTY